MTGRKGGRALTALLVGVQLSDTGGGVVGLVHNALGELAVCHLAADIARPAGLRDVLGVARPLGGHHC